MISPFISRKLNKCLKAIEDSLQPNGIVMGDDLKKIYTPENLKALLALENAGCIRATRYDNSDFPVYIQLDDHASVKFQISRLDVWVNRIGGFIFGIVSTLLVEVVLYFIECKVLLLLK